MGLNCSICPSHCCGRLDIGPPILMPFEIARFHWIERYEESDGIFRLKRSAMGDECIYLSPNQKCMIYEDRPTECKLYPYILKWEDEKVGLKLHELCPQKENAEIPSIPDGVLNIDEKFWRAFMNSPI